MAHLKEKRAKATGAAKVRQGKTPTRRKPANPNPELKFRCPVCGHKKK